MPAIPLDRNAWTEPGTFEVAPGVHRIPLPLPNDGLRAVNVYALDHGDGLLLIDSGWAIPGGASGRARRRPWPRSGYGRATSRRILVTHVHRDHYTQAIVAAARVRRPGQPGHRGAAESLAISPDAGRDAAAEPAWPTCAGSAPATSPTGRPAGQGPRDPNEPAGRRPTSGCATAR